MSSINSVRNLQILYLSKKNKEIKKSKKWRKKVSWDRHFYILLGLKCTKDKVIKIF